MAHECVANGRQEALGEMPFEKLLWARYSAFLPLYPLGVASELTMVWLALPTIYRDRPLSLSLPNSFNFSFDYYWLCIILSIIYIPGELFDSVEPLLIRDSPFLIS